MVNSRAKADARASGGPATRRAAELARRGRTVVGWANDRGPRWTTLALWRAVTDRLAGRAAKKMLAIERERHFTGAGTVSSRTNTIDENRAIWDQWDWTDGGEQWTRDAAALKGADPDEWKAGIVDLIRREVPPGSVVLEVGPGGGRWTEVLKGLASHLVLVDISRTCLDVCRKRFGSGPEIEYQLVDARGGLDVDAESIDVVWSYDVFVHINPTDVNSYLAEFSRILKPEGRAVIHHAGQYDDDDRRDDYRAEMTREWFADLARRNGLEVMSQDASLPHKPGDVITFLRRPAAPAPA